jgi:carboxyl-terminal processing protease
LVQRPFKLRDGSTLKLTTARYYTPAGRCIQRPYEEGNEEYRKEGQRRRDNGELFSMDSVHVDDHQEYFTDNKRVVYGGGGILPDVFISLDTSENSDFLRDLLSNGLFYQYINEYVDANRDELTSKYPDFETFDANFAIEGKFMDDFFAFAEKEMKPKKVSDDIDFSALEDGELLRGEDVMVDAEADSEEKDFATRKEEGMAASGKIIRTRLKALLARTIWQTEAFYRVFNADDDAVLKAIESIDDKTFRRLKLSYN